MIGIVYADNGAQGASAPSFMGILPPLLMMMVIFYFLLIRPQQKKQKEKDETLKALKEGDNVVTTGGIYGSISKIKGDTVVLKIAENVKIKIERSAVNGLKNEP